MNKGYTGITVEEFLLYVFQSSPVMVYLTPFQNNRGRKQSSLITYQIKSV